MISEKLVGIKNEVDTQEDIINSIALALNGRAIPDPWELIADVSLTEGVSNVVINTDINGNGFSLSKIRFLFESVGDSESTAASWGSIYISPTTSNNWYAGRNVYGNQAGMIKATGKVDEYHGLIDLDNHISILGRLYGADRAYPTYDPIGEFSDSANYNVMNLCFGLVDKTAGSVIKQFSIGGNGQKYGAGTKIKIWGVRE